ncbi:MAG: Na(+)/H(+) antiporter subunit D [Steroidobacteraceae bacterium]
MPDLLPPGLWLTGGALLIGALRGRARAALVLALPLVTLWAVWQVPDGIVASREFLGFVIEPVEGSPVRRLFAVIFSLMAFAGGLFAFRQAGGRELAAASLYAGSAVGVCFSGDLVSLFVWWELMAIGSMIVVWCGDRRATRAAGLRYAIMHLTGGALLLAGIAAHAAATGSIDVAALTATTPANWMILAGLLVNVAAPPVSAWLADAYPESSATGAVFLSAYTTKAAVLALILLFPGEPVLMAIGTWMIFYGILYALLENDARRILAYSIVNQVGFMVCAIGIGTHVALNGAAAHAFAHIIYKALLFMSAGVVVYRTGLHRCTELGGLFRTMPLTAVCGIVGALSISGFPLTSGFTTKTLISEAAKGDGLMLLYFLLAAASAGVFLHAGIKFPWFVFFQKDSGLRPRDAPWNMAAAMLLFSFLCLLIGVYPQPFYALLPYPVDFDAYTAGNVLFYLQLLLFSGLAFFLLLPLMKRTQTLTLDFDWLWRVALYRLGAGALATMDLAAERVVQMSRFAGARLAAGLRRHFGEDGGFARSWPIGTTALWLAVLLSFYVLIHYL